MKIMKIFHKLKKLKKKNTFNEIISRLDFLGRNDLVKLQDVLYDLLDVI